MLKPTVHMVTAGLEKVGVKQYNSGFKVHSLQLSLLMHTVILPHITTHPQLKLYPSLHSKDLSKDL
jgi:hypothetical protein